MQAKPRWIAGAVAVIAACLMLMVGVPTYPMILAGQSVIGVAGTLVAPALAAVSLGLVGRSGLDTRVGRNAALGAAGTVLWALGTGWVGHACGTHAMFRGAIAQTSGYAASCVALTCVATAALALFALGMPETRHGGVTTARPDGAPAGPAAAS